MYILHVTHTHIHVHIHTTGHTHSHTCTCTCTYYTSYTYSHTLTYMYMYILHIIHTHVRVHTTHHTHTHTCTCTYYTSHTLTYMYMYILHVTNLDYNNSFLYNIRNFCLNQFNQRRDTSLSSRLVKINKNGFKQKNKILTHFHFDCTASNGSYRLTNKVNIHFSRVSNYNMCIIILSKRRPLKPRYSPINSAILNRKTMKFGDQLPLHNTFHWLPVQNG